MNKRYKDKKLLLFNNKHQGIKNYKNEIQVKATKLETKWIHIILCKTIF